MSSVVLAVFQCWYPHTIIMQLTAPLQRAGDKAISKNLIFFSRKQQGGIRTDWKIYFCIFYHLWTMVMIFKVANSLSIFQKQYLLWYITENRWKVIIYNHVKSKKPCHQKTFHVIYWSAYHWRESQKHKKMTKSHLCINL